MASDTVPAAVPGPGDPAGTTPTSTPAPQPRGLAGLLSAVEPARPTGFHITPTTTAGQGEQETVNGVSSADYHADGNTTQNGTEKTSNSSGGGRQERSVIRAWMLAGAKRWEQGGAARIKRLEMQKARHQANQVKETRTVSVNRSGGTLSGSTVGSGGGKPGGGKSLTSKTNSKGATKGPRNTPGGTNRFAGRPGNGGSGGGSGSGGGAGRGPSGRSNTTGGGTRGTKGNGGIHNHGTTKTPHGKDHNTSKTPKTLGPKTGPTSARGPKSGSSGATTGGGNTGPQGPAGPSGKHNGTTSTKDSKTSTGAGPSANGSRTKGADGGKDRTKKVELEKKTGKTNDPTTTGARTPGSTTTGKTSLDKSGAKTPTPQKPGTGNRIHTQDSRETGYRDGTRAAKVVAHVEAYKDGVKDGYRDTKEAAGREKARLDTAHQQRKQQRNEDQPVTGASSADYHPTQPQTAPQGGPQPVQVTSVDANTVHLGDGAARSSMTRGEVRTVKQFERRLEAKADTMTRIADAAKAFGERDKERTKAITYLLEQARAVQGGEGLVTDLLRLREAATVREAKIVELHRRSVRAADNTRALLSNVKARYGGMYKAVVDSPLTKPAEASYYRK